VSRAPAWALGRQRPLPEGLQGVCLGIHVPRSFQRDPLGVVVPAGSTQFRLWVREQHGENLRRIRAGERVQISEYRLPGPAA
jgi:hypothetical protein